MASDVEQDGKYEMLGLKQAFATQDNYSVRSIETIKCVTRRTEHTDLMSLGSRLAYSIARSYKHAHKHTL